MIHNDELARAINRDRYSRGHDHRVVAEVQMHPIRRAVGRWLEHLGRRLQGPARPSRSSV